MEANSIVFYQTEETDVVVNVVYKDETFWLTQKAMAELFDVKPQAITKHLQIYMKRMNCNMIQLVPFWNKFKKKVPVM